MKPSILLKHGKLNLKVSFSNEFKKIESIPNMIGRLLFRKPLKYGDKSPIKLEELKYLSFGDEIKKYFPLLYIEDPLDDYQGTDILWDYMFCKKLGLNQNELKERNIMLIEKTLDFKKIRNKIEIIFEKFNFGNCNVEFIPKLALLNIGEENGIALDIGEELTYAIPVLKGNIIKNKVYNYNIGGKNITNYLFLLLQ